MTRDWFLLGLRMVAPILMYLFLGIMFYQLREQHPKQPQEKVHLKLVEDPNQIWLLAPYTSLGRHQNNTIMLDDEFVSAYHATLTHKDDGWWLIDLNSTNGITINNHQVKTPIQLNYNDVIRLGSKDYQLYKKG